MSYTAKLRDNLLNFGSKKAIIIYILCRIWQKLEVAL